MCILRTLSPAIQACGLGRIASANKAGFRQSLGACASNSSNGSGGNVVRHASSSSSSSSATGGLPRFHSDKLPSSIGELVRVEGNEFWHMAKALRLGPADRLELFDGQGGIVEVQVVNVGKDAAHLAATQPPRVVPWEGARWHLAVACGTLKGGRADWLIEKCTELGAASVTPMLTERSPNLGEGRMDRLERVSLAALKQSQRLHAMDLYKPTPLADLLPQVKAMPVAYLAQGNAQPFADATSARDAVPSALLIVGPEGDLTAGEVECLVGAGAVSVGLGPRRLRVETAAIAMLSHLMLSAETCLP